MTSAATQHSDDFLADDDRASQDAASRIANMRGAPLELLRYYTGTGATLELHVSSVNGWLRAFVADGQVAWVKCSRVQENLGHLLERRAGVDGQTLRDAITHAREHSVPLADALEARGTLRRDRFLSLYAAHAGHHLWEARALGGDCYARVVRCTSGVDTELRFSVDQIIAEHLCESAMESGALKVVHVWGNGMTLASRSGDMASVAGNALRTAQVPSVAGAREWSQLRAVMERFESTARDGQPETMTWVASDATMLIQRVADHTGVILGALCAVNKTGVAVGAVSRVCA